MQVEKSRVQKSCDRQTIAFDPTIFRGQDGHLKDRLGMGTTAVGGGLTYQYQLTDDVITRPL